MIDDPTALTHSRRANGQYNLFKNGTKVGEIWRNKHGFRLSLIHCLWRNIDEPWQTGGTGGITVPRLVDAMALAEKTLKAKPLSWKD